MKASNRPYRMIISGGGTGGHIFPAVAIADEFKSRFPDSEILFIGASDRMEMNRVPRAGYQIEGLWISGLQRNLSLRNLLFPVKLLWSLYKASKIISRFKPDVVVGTGGFASGPTVIVANRKKIPVLLQEQNSFPGLTNRQFAGKAKKICVAYEGMDKYFKADQLILTGNPVRQDIDGLGNRRTEGRKFFGLKEDTKVLLVLGGSLGARTINNTMLDAIEGLVEKGLEVIWQTGKLYYDEMKAKATRNQNDGVHITKFIDRMDLAYDCADLAVSRAGALSVSELCLTGLPVIFVPSPNVAEDHQRKNALSLVEKNAARIVEDNEAAGKLKDVILDLIGDSDEMKRLGANIRNMAKPNATKEIVDELEKIIN